LAVEGEGLSSARDIDTPTRLAFDRTRLAHDRTMMAWVRTSTSMITFGFSVYKFFQLEMERVAHATRVIGPPEFSMLLIGMGVVALLIATFEYRASMKSLKLDYPGMVTSPLASIVAGVLTVLGLLALIAVVLRK
jgi:putative membrane protein